MVIWIFQKLLKNQQKEKNNHTKQARKKDKRALAIYKKQVENDNQVFWVCPLIEDSSILDYSSAKKNLNYLMINSKIK